MGAFTRSCHGEKYCPGDSFDRNTRYQGCITACVGAGKVNALAGHRRLRKMLLTTVLHGVGPVLCQTKTTLIEPWQGVATTYSKGCSEFVQVPTRGMEKTLRNLIYVRTMHTYEVFRCVLKCGKRKLSKPVATS